MIEQEFRKKISLSYNYLNSNNIKSKYFNNSPELMQIYGDRRLIRYSTKGNDGKTACVEIYTDKGELILRTEPR